MTIDVEIVFTQGGNISTLTRQFVVMPRIGERILISEEGALHAGIIEDVEHKANPRSIVEPTIYVNGD